MSAAPSDPLGRFQMRSRGELQLPGSCMICGSGTCDEGYVDFGIFVDYHGTLYFCVPCVKEVAQVIGCITPEDNDIFAEATEEKLALLVETQKELEDARKHIDNLNAVLTSKLLSNSAVVEGVTEEPVKPSQAPSGPVKGPAKRKSNPKESTPIP